MRANGNAEYSDLEKRMDKIRISLFWVFVVALIISLVLATMGWKYPVKAGDLNWPPIKIAQAVMLSLWIFLPPVWFWLEYFFGSWEKNVAYGDDEKARFERLKYGQDLSSKIWIAVSTVLLMLYFGKDIR